MAKFDDLQKVKNIPSPLTGEGWGEGEESRIFARSFIPLPFIPSHQGRGNFSFHGAINFDDPVKGHIY
jgi:hypothetical protein